MAFSRSWTKKVVPSCSESTPKRAPRRSVTVLNFGCAMMKCGGFCATLATMRNLPPLKASITSASTLAMAMWARPECITSLIFSALSKISNRASMPSSRK